MAPNSATITSLLRQTVYYHLDNLNYDNALFFSERLQAQDPRSSESAYLLALCHLRIGDFRSAYEASKQAGYRGTNLSCTFVFAQACLYLERYKDGINAMEKCRPLWTNKNSLGKHSAWARTPYPDSASINCLLGKLFKAFDDKKKAVVCFEEALKDNPMMWDAFTNLCDMGVCVRSANIFKATDSLARNFDQELASRSDENAASTNPPEGLFKKSVLQPTGLDRAGLELGNPFTSGDVPAALDYGSAPNGRLVSKAPENDFLSRIAAARSRNAQNQILSKEDDGMDTPTSQVPTTHSHLVAQAARASHQVEAPAITSRRSRFGQSTLRSLRKDKTQETTSDSSASLLERKRTASGHPVQTRAVANGEEPRRSARLNVFQPRTTSTKTASSASTLGAARELKKARAPISRIIRPGSSESSVGRVVSGNRKPVEENAMDIDHVEPTRIREALAASVPKSVELESAKTDEALKWILDLLKKMASGYLLSSQFQCQEAVNAYTSLPRAHHDTPWVLAQMGNAQYEQANYAEAEKLFRRLRLLAPARLEGMEVYSTVLWHLARETDLSFLAHELVNAVWDSPQAWCALGNAWSLARDHEQALKSFRRATQLDPKFAYAYTLQGHEHFMNEEYDKAKSAYRSAMSCDKRHYNAYYGLGRVHEKMGNFDKALYHFRVAYNIHPTHAVLICCIGKMFEKQRSNEEALQYYTKAVDLAPKNTIARYRRAKAYMKELNLEGAKKDLMVLKDLSPDDPQVHCALGRLFKALHDKKSAVRHYTIALSLDPKASQYLKTQIEHLDDHDWFCDDSMMQ